MGRVLLTLSLVVILLATGVAFASPVASVRVPITVAENEPGAEMVVVNQMVVVEKGDHLWKISARHLSEVDPDSRIAPYWRSVVDLNQPRLRSGDPDLIYPGELIELPPMSGLP
jgi:nucleoid-associated protein YgaU